LNVSQALNDIFYGIVGSFIAFPLWLGYLKLQRFFSEKAKRAEEERNELAAFLMHGPLNRLVVSVAINLALIVGASILAVLGVLTMILLLISGDHCSTGHGKFSSVEFVLWGLTSLAAYMGGLVQLNSNVSELFRLSRARHGKTAV